MSHGEFDISVSTQNIKIQNCEQIDFLSTERYQKQKEKVDVNLLNQET